MIGRCWIKSLSAGGDREIKSAVQSKRAPLSSARFCAQFSFATVFSNSKHRIVFLLEILTASFDWKKKENEGVNERGSDARGFLKKARATATEKGKENKKRRRNASAFGAARLLLQYC